MITPVSKSGPVSAWWMTIINALPKHTGDYKTCGFQNRECSIFYASYNGKEIDIRTQSKSRGHFGQADFDFVANKYNSYVARQTKRKDMKKSWNTSYIISLIHHLV